MPWLHCLRPHPDELLSSWLRRLALVNRRTNHTLCKYMFGDEAIWNRDLDRHFPDALLPVLSEWTRVPVARVRRTTLDALTGRLAVEVRRVGTANWILPLGVYHRIRRRGGLQFCPQCLRRESGYARRAWRVAPVTVCVTHRRMLLDRCPRCACPFMFHRVYPSVSSRWPCPNCGFDLATTTLGPAIAPTVLQLQCLLWRGVHSGHVIFQGQRLDVLEFVNGLRYLVQSMAIRRLGGLGTSTGLQQGLVRDRTGKALFEHQPVEIRHAIMSVLADWLGDPWPSRLIDSVQGSLRHPSVMEADRDPAPPWLLAALRQVPAWTVFTRKTPRRRRPRPPGADSADADKDALADVEPGSEPAPG